MQQQNSHGHVRHYVWAGMDFMFDSDGIPVLLEANKASHMWGEYLHYHANERPFQLAAAEMNQAEGPPCLLWRRGDPFADADEDACFIGQYLTKYLKQSPYICNVEDNQADSEELVNERNGQLRNGGFLMPQASIHLVTKSVKRTCLLGIATAQRHHCGQPIADDQALSSVNHQCDLASLR